MTKLRMPYSKVLLGLLLCLLAVPSAIGQGNETNTTGVSTTNATATTTSTTSPAAGGGTNGTQPTATGASNATTGGADANATTAAPAGGANVTVAPSGVGGGANTTESPASNGTTPTTPPTTTGDNTTTTNTTTTTTTTTSPGSSESNATTTTPPSSGSNVTTTAPTSAGAGSGTGNGTGGATISATDKVYFTFQYGFADGVAREPTQAEIEDLICQTNLFIQGRVRNGTKNQNVVTTATNIDWVYDETANPEQPVSVSFFSSNLVPGMEEQVAVQQVQSFLQLTPPEITNYLQNYVWNVTLNNSLFGDAVDASVDDVLGQPVPVGKLTKVTCPFTGVATSPTVPPGSNTPTMGAGSTGNTSTTTTAPSSSSGGAANTTTAGGNGTTTVAPGGGGPTSPPLPRGTVRMAVNTKFIVTNLEKTTDPTTLNNSGLSAAWPPFVEQVVTDTASANNQQAQRRLGQQQETGSRYRRRLAVQLEPGTAFIYDIILKETCGQDTHPDSTCHDVYGTYNILLSGDDADLENQQPNRDRYGDATVAAIDSGKLQTVLETETPGTPLYIGTVAAPGSGDDGGMPTWLLILIILLCVLLLCCCLGALAFYLMRDKDQSGGKALEPYDEEGFAYDFLIPPNQQVQTEVNDDVDESAATKNVDEDEMFEDDDGDVKVSKVAAEKDETPKAPATIVEESDDGVKYIDGDDGDDGDDDDGDDFDEDDDDDDNKKVNVSAEVKDEDDDDDGDDDDDDPDIRPVSNDLEESDNFDDADDKKDDEDWDDEDEEPEKKK